MRGDAGGGRERACASGGRSGNRAGGGQASACEGCLRRAALIGELAPYIARALDEHRRLPALLSLEEQELLSAVCGSRRSGVERALAAFDPAHARQQAAEADLAPLCRHDPGYPARLLEAPDAPALLYVRGDLSRLAHLLREKPVAVVGSRRASAYGLEVAFSLGRELAACGVPVVSGMALGADSAAHEGALGGAGLTLAVLAGGANVPYPRARRHLYRRIAQGGLIVSELPPGSRPFRWCFPARNRIMAGLSAMTVVVEGSDTSGSLITAQFAADLGREVGAVPGQVTSPLARGPNALIADGALVVRSAADVLDALYGTGWRREHHAGRPVPDLEPRLRTLLGAVERGAGAVDSIARNPAQVADTLAGLTELELAGLVRRTADGRYVRRA